MTKFIVTGSFTGQFSVVYDDNNTIAEINFMGAELAANQRAWIKKYIPVIFDDSFSEFAALSKLTWIEERYEVTFDQFWEAYDLKVHKKRAQDVWGRTGKADKVKAMMGIRPYDRHLQETGYGKAHADTYLREKYFENEWHKLTK